MKAVLLMFDTLNRHLLQPYGCDWTHTPNFMRLAEKTVVFDNCYAGSLPCMPARRELHTGRYNFLHRSWGPIEPYDDSMPENLKKSGVYTHLISDHYHYWEDGGSTYHNRYSSWEFVRGQEGDPWKGSVCDPEIPKEYLTRADEKFWRQNWVNRGYFSHEKEYPVAKTLDLGLQFLKENRDADNWFLQLELFDPHEPFITPRKYKDLYRHEYNGPHFDWPTYTPVKNGVTEEQIRHIRFEYASLLSMCDEYLGKFLDYMDEASLWDDTMLIVNTDHGFLLGEHGWLAKNKAPWFQEAAHTPLFVWDPRFGLQGERNTQLVQMIDIAPTLYDYFNVLIPDTVQGLPLRIPLSEDRKVRKGALYGLHGGQVNCTDGRYVYMRSSKNHDGQPLYDYTLMPTHLGTFFSHDELSGTELAEPFSFTKNLRVMKIPVQPSHGTKQNEYGHMLFDLADDPWEQNPLDSPEVENKMIRLMMELMKENDAPPEQYERLGLDG